MHEYILKSRRKNTSKKYLYFFNRGAKFISSKQKPAILANPIHISLYLTHLHNNGCSFHVISSAYYAIQWALSIFGHRDPTDHLFVHNLVESSKRHNKPKVSKKEIITTNDLISLCDINVSSNNLMAVRDLCMIASFFCRSFAIGWIKFLSMFRQVITFKDGYIKIRINKIKTDQNRQGREMFISSVFTSACQVNMLIRKQRHYFR